MNMYVYVLSSYKIGNELESELDFGVHETNVDELRSFWH